MPKPQRPANVWPAVAVCLVCLLPCGFASLIAFVVVVPELCYFAEYGTKPKCDRAWAEQAVKVGMAEADVVRTLGTPHTRLDYAGGQRWEYDLGGIFSNRFVVEFDADGVVVRCDVVI